jgi:hypothetical protein
MPLTGPIPEGRSFFCPHCGALYSVTHSGHSNRIPIDVFQTIFPKYADRHFELVTCNVL